MQALGPTSKTQAGAQGSSGCWEETEGGEERKLRREASLEKARGANCERGRSPGSKGPSRSVRVGEAHSCPM